MHPILRKIQKLIMRFALQGYNNRMEDFTVRQYMFQEKINVKIYNNLETDFDGLNLEYNSRKRRFDNPSNLWYTT